MLGPKKYYEPELGQLAFGQPWKEYKLSVVEETAISAMSSLWEVFKPNEDSPFGNTGARYEGKNFRVHAYSWNDEEEQEFNLAWRDFRISWYKHCERGESINKRMSEKQVKEMILEFIEEIK